VSMKVSPSACEGEASACQYGVPVATTRLRPTLDWSFVCQRVGFLWGWVLSAGRRYSHLSRASLSEWGEGARHLAPRLRRRDDWVIP
jgi:hypothetical protein